MPGELLARLAGLLGMPLGEAPARPLCLACGAANQYGSEDCVSCGLELPAFPPFLHSNHVCQLQLAVAAHEEGALTRTDLLRVYATFTELIALHEPDWPADFAPARASLAAALESLDRWAEQDQPGLLAPVEEHLTDFFQYTCQECAELIHRLEQQAPASSGSLVDSVQ